MLLLLLPSITSIFYVKVICTRIETNQIATKTSRYNMIQFNRKAIEVFTKLKTI